MDEAATLKIITAVLDRAPEWIRHDFASKDVALRNGAEEALATIIAAALSERGASA